MKIKNGIREYEIHTLMGENEPERQQVDRLEQGGEDQRDEQLDVG